MKQLPRFAFFGSPPIGPATLEALARRKLVPTVIVSDTKADQVELAETIEAAGVALILVAGYGRILKRPVLDSVAGQVLNLHPSLLPLYRGPAPVVSALLDGAAETGITLIELDREVDHGPVLAQERIALNGRETADELYPVLMEIGVQLFMDAIHAYLDEELSAIPQDHGEATFTAFVRKSDGRLDLRDSVEINLRKVRAYAGWPGTWLMDGGTRLIVLSAIQQGGAFMPLEVLPAGKRSMRFTEYARGRRMEPSQLLRGMAA